jgi:hypothetical protein
MDQCLHCVERGSDYRRCGTAALPCNIPESWYVNALKSDHEAAIREAVEKAVNEERDRVFSICVDKNHEMQLQRERIAELEFDPQIFGRFVTDCGRF